MFVEITATKRVLQTLIDGMARFQEMNDLQNFKRCSAVDRYLTGETCTRMLRVEQEPDPICFSGSL